MKRVHTDNAPAAVGPYSQAVISGNLVYTSGQIALSPHSGEVIGDTAEDQTETVLGNLAEVLRAAGSSLEQVIKTTCFLKDLSQFDAFNQVYAKYFPHRPARSCVEVSALPKRVLVEIEAIAEITGKSGE